MRRQRADARRGPNPLRAGAILLSLALFAVFLLSALDERTGAVRDGDRRVLRIRAGSAPLVASDLAGFQERRRREGRGYARDTDALVAAWVRRLEPRERDEMLCCPARAAAAGATPTPRGDGHRPPSW